MRWPGRATRASPARLAALAVTSAGAAAACAVVAACAALPADPGFSQEYARDRRAEYRAAIHGQVQALLLEWRDAIARGDADRVIGLYDPDAWVLLDYPAQGPDLRPAVEDWVRGTRSVLTGPADFDFSGDLAFAVVRLLVTTADGHRRTGSMIVVARRTGDDWKIRSQLLNFPDQ